MGMREKLIELLNKVQDMGVTVIPAGMGDTYDHVWNQKVADHLIANGVTIPVHCKDCKHWSDGVAGCTDHVKCCKIGFYMVGENGYCVYGERKQDEQDSL